MAGEEKPNMYGSYILSTTLTKGFSILEYIAENQPGTPPQIQKDVGLTKGNVHRLLATLEYLGYITKMKDGYYLTYKMFVLGNTVHKTRDLSKVARNYMENLSENTKQNVYLCVPRENNMISLDHVTQVNDIQIVNDQLDIIDPWHFLETIRQDISVYRALPVSSPSRR